MSSGRQVQSNRANARASTGPKTPAGKARVGHNALRHGLATSVLDDGQWAPEVRALARRIAGDRIEAGLLQLANVIAEAQIELRRVRAHRRRLVERALINPNVSATEMGERDLELTPELRRDGKSEFDDRYTDDWDTDDRDERAMDDFISEMLRAEDMKRSAEISKSIPRELAAIDRYERRALSRRKFAIRAFDALQIEIKRKLGGGPGAA
jgi:hypothetical protein